MMEKTKNNINVSQETRTSYTYQFGGVQSFQLKMGTPSLETGLISA